MKIEVYKCDACKTLVEDDINIYRIDLESIGKKVCSDGESSEVKSITLEFCLSCTTTLAASMAFLKERIELIHNV